jgi:beta-N-acetylhexosaminidase
MEQLDSLELYPFRQIFKAGIGSVMIAHLSIPSIDTALHRPTSLSKNNVTGLLLNQLGYDGLLFTDGLEMKGVTKYFSPGEVSVQALIAGNDMLCLPENIPLAIGKIKEAIVSGRLSMADIERHCKKVLMIKYLYGLADYKPINTVNLTNDLNSEVAAMRKLVAENALTVLSKTDSVYFPMTLPKKPVPGEVVYVSVGMSADNAFAKRMRNDYKADVFYFNYKQDAARILSTVALIKKRYKKVVIGIHNYNRAPANNFGISKTAIDFVTQLQQQTNSISFVFGNPYAIKNWCAAKNLVACYEDDSIVQNTAIDLLQGKIVAKGKLPVTVCDKYTFGSGIAAAVFFCPPQPRLMWASAPMSSAK